MAASAAGAPKCLSEVESGNFSRCSEQPKRVERVSWLQTVPGKGWFTILRMHGPLEPWSYNTWLLGDVEPLK